MYTPITTSFVCYDPCSCCQSADQKEEGILLDWVHPSVFQLWHDRQPRRRTDSVSEDCQQLKGLSAQRTCSQRLRHVRDYCSKREAEEAENGAFSDLGEGGDVGDVNGRPSINDSVVDVFSYRRGKTMVMYCSVHKVASTYWLRLFRFLHNDTNTGPVASPEAVSKYKVHLTAFKESRPLALAYVTRMLGPGDEEFRFLFTRNPYRRLWAVYIDKFVLPDFYFWSYHGRAIKDMSSQNYDSNQRLMIFNGCLEVSFEEFVRYAIQDPSSPTAHSDDHLLPISRTCNPCAFQPHFIGRIESMTDDSWAVLERLNFTNLLQKKNFQDRALDQIRTVTEFVHDTVVARGNLRFCVSDDELQARLLRAFILSGYFPPDVAEVRRTSVATSVTDLLNMMKELFLVYNRGEGEVEAQRKQFFVNAYDSLPRDLLYGVRDYYREDFNAFGYNPEPPELFAERQDKEQILSM